VAPAGTGAPKADRHTASNGYVLNTISPKPTHCHYFWRRAQPSPDRAALTTEIATARRAFSGRRDHPEAGSSAHGRKSGSRVYNLNIDAGASGRGV